MYIRRVLLLHYRHTIILFNTVGSFDTICRLLYKALYKQRWLNYLYLILYQPYEIYYSDKPDIVFNEYCWLSEDFMQAICKSLWIKVSVKWININVILSTASVEEIDELLVWDCISGPCHPECGDQGCDGPDADHCLNCIHFSLGSLKSGRCQNHISTLNGFSVTDSEGRCVQNHSMRFFCLFFNFAL